MPAEPSNPGSLRRVAEIKPFRAIRYDEGRAGPLERNVAPPYDVIGLEERLGYLARSPYNVVHLTLPESEDQAARDFASWRGDGVLAEDEDPALWALEQDYVGPDGIHRTRHGILAALRAEPYEDRVVLPHELTHSAPKEGRLRLLRAVRAQLEPIFLLYDGEAPLEFPSGDPDLEAEGAGAVSRLWRIAEPGIHEAVRDWFAAKQLLIADGHHRYETTLAFSAQDGSPESGYMMAVLVSTDDPGLEIFPTHRIVKHLERIDSSASQAVPGGPYEGLRELEAVPKALPAAVVYRKGETLLLLGKEPEPDARFVERLGLEGVTYTPHGEDAIAQVDSGQAEAAVLLRPPPIDQVKRIAERGETMPQKSTYFYPKLLSGLLFLALDLAPLAGNPSRPAEPASEVA
jgi:uncharacterized protein (DUF1015 family)